MALLGGITLVPLVTLLWLGARLLAQDHALESQQIQQRVDRAADVVVAAIQRAISESSERLSAGKTDWPDGAVSASLFDDRVELSPAGRVAYLPVVPRLPEPTASLFEDGDDLALRSGDINGAAAVLRHLAQSRDAPTRAGALLRLGRVLQKARRFDEALDAFDGLSKITSAAINATPPGLVAAYARATLLESAGRASELRAEGQALERHLDNGTWAVTWPIYQLYKADAARWNGRTEAQVRSRGEVFAEALAAVWERRSVFLSSAHGSGVDAVAVSDRHVAVLSRLSGEVPRVLLADESFVKSQWLTRAAAIGREQSTLLTLRDAGGAPLFGDAVSNEKYATTRTPAQSGLPWSVVVTAVDPPEEGVQFSRRRSLLAVGLVLLITLAVAASYATVRAVTRELETVQLQSDFVAAVSHEFRTPLTSLRQFTELLRDQSALPDEQRRLAYDVQWRATDRLTRLVESLLEFGRTEAGARRYAFAIHDCSSMVHRFVEDYHDEARASGHVVQFRGTDPVDVDVDTEAMGRAVRNLLDNAIKYSPAATLVNVAVTREPASVRISVRDSGFGIPAHEHARIFGKFHRGEEARTRGIKGTGIGLAMVDEIIRAHRGRVEVESTPGAGSTFTIVLPIHRDEATRNVVVNHDEYGAHSRS